MAFGDGQGARNGREPKPPADAQARYAPLPTLRRRPVTEVIDQRGE